MHSVFPPLVILSFVRCFYRFRKCCVKQCQKLQRSQYEHVVFFIVLVYWLFQFLFSFDYSSEVEEKLALFAFQVLLQDPPATARTNTRILTLGHRTPLPQSYLLSFQLCRCTLGLDNKKCFTHQAVTTSGNKSLG